MASKWPDGWLQQKSSNHARKDDQIIIILLLLLHSLQKTLNPNPTNQESLDQATATAPRKLTSCRQQDIMKLQAILAIAIAAIAASAAPADTDTAPAAIAADKCSHPSDCSWWHYGKCEDYCGQREFSHMSTDDCGFLKKRCCCV
ncbi:hypothetical protein V8F06_010664 [Rhypophila decipiens]